MFDLRSKQTAPLHVCARKGPGRQPPRALSAVVSFESRMIFLLFAESICYLISGLVVEFT